MKASFAIILFVLAAPVAFSQIVLKTKDNGITANRPFIQQPFNPLKYNLNKPEPLPQNYYTQHLPFFCRQELKMQQAHVPVTFRLGSMDQCNRLEQKPGYR